MKFFYINKQKGHSMNYRTGQRLKTSNNISYYIGTDTVKLHTICDILYSIVNRFSPFPTKNKINSLYIKPRNTFLRRPVKWSPHISYELASSLNEFIGALCQRHNINKYNILHSIVNNKELTYTLRFRDCLKSRVLPAMKTI